MRIAQVSPLFESVPPRLYGGTERIVSFLTEELIQLGHSVTLFASGDSETSARLVSPCRRGLRLSDRYVDPLSYHLLMLAQVAKMSREFDVIHYHIDYLHFPLSRLLDVAHLTTLHGRLDLPELPPIYGEFKETPVISISNSQRTPLPWLNWIDTIYHGLPSSHLKFCPTPSDYVVFLGRFSPEKRADRAIEMAIRAGIRIKIAAKVESSDEDYFHSKIKPLLGHPLVEYSGEISEREKSDFLGGAQALLFPIEWPEPFGLVMIEALACGTPVIAFAHGSVPEIVEHGKTGFLADTVEEGIDALLNIDRIRREDCRREFESRFTARRMAEDYVTAYEQLAWTGDARRRRGRFDSRGRQGVRPGDLAAS